MGSYNYTVTEPIEHPCCDPLPSPSLHHSITPSLPQLPGQGSKRGGESSTTSASLKRNREDDDVRNVVEVFPVDGVSGRLVNYFTDQMGEIVVADVRKGNIDVLFHVNQVQGTLISQVWG